MSLVNRVHWTDVLQLSFALAGTVAAARAGSFGLSLLFAAAGLTLVARLRPARRRSVAIRADLATWIDEVSAATGESTSTVADRALSAYRAAMARDG